MCMYLKNKSRTTCNEGSLPKKNVSFLLFNLIKNYDLGVLVTSDSANDK